MAKGTGLAVWMDLQNHPLGTRENMSVPLNYVIPPARVYLLNHSRTRAWKRAVVTVSTRRGAEEVLIYDRKQGGGELAELYNVELLYKAVEGGRDMNRYESSIKPVVFSFEIDGVKRPIPPAKDDKSKPPQVEVHEGSIDMFLGNYERMRAMDKDGRPNKITRDEEANRLAIRWRAKHNPVFRFTDDGESQEWDNPYGFIEVVRVSQKALTEPIDKEFLQALDMVEV